jgi:hypothetical protein
MDKVKVVEKTEFVFDILYPLAVFIMGVCLLVYAGGMKAKQIAGAMALTLFVGECFRLIPRMVCIKRGDSEGLEAALGHGKQITSLTSAIFYMLLWELACTLYSLNPLGGIGIAVYVLGSVRIALCIAPVKQWHGGSKGALWSKLRNIPFLFMGLIVAAVYIYYQSAVRATLLMWLAIILSFCCYIPVVLIPKKQPQITFSMIAQSCCYIWIIAMCLFI